MLRVGKEDGKKKYFVLESTEKRTATTENLVAVILLGSMRTTTIRALAKCCVMVIRCIQPPCNEKHTDLSVTG